MENEQRETTKQVRENKKRRKKNELPLRLLPEQRPIQVNSFCSLFSISSSFSSLLSELMFFLLSSLLDAIELLYCVVMLGLDQ